MQNSVDRETDRDSWCCSESGRCILGLFVLPVTRCHCDLCCTRCVPYGQLGSGQGRIRDLSHKTPICIRPSNKALLSLKEKRIKNSCYICSGPKGSPIHKETGSPSSLIELCQQQPSHFSPLSIPPFSKVKARLLSVSKKKKKWLVTAQKTIFNSRQCTSLFALSPTLEKCRPIAHFFFPL